jgi:hypothetical protein
MLFSPLLIRISKTCSRLEITLVVDSENISINYTNRKAMSHVRKDLQVEP